MTVVRIVTLSIGDIRIEQRDFLLALAQDGRYDLIFGTGTIKPVTNNRNNIMKVFRESPPEHKYLLMLDDDIVVHGNPLDYIEKEPDIVVFPAPLWMPSQRDVNPIAWNIRIRDAEGNLYKGKFGSKKETISISEGGTGAILISREVADHPALRHPFVEVTDSEGLTVLGHDLDFTKRARELGFAVWAALDMPCSHWDYVDLGAVYAYFRKYEEAIDVYEAELRKWTDPDGGIR